MKLPLARLVASLLLSAAAAHAKPCGNPSAVLETREAAEAQCACGAATRHRSYMSCVLRVAHEAVVSGALSPRCKAAVMSCAQRSVCGKPHYRTCCRTPPEGHRTYQLQLSAGRA